MYSEADFADIRRRIARGRRGLAAALILLAAALGLALYRRAKPAAYIAGGALAAAAVFGVGFYILPCRRYLTFLQNLRDGGNREMAGTVLEIANEARLQDGARVLPVRLWVEAARDERIVYLNASKRALFPEAGAEVRLKLCGRHILGVYSGTGTSEEGGSA